MIVDEEDSQKDVETDLDDDDDEILAIKKNTKQSNNTEINKPLKNSPTQIEILDDPIEVTDIDETKTTQTSSSFLSSSSSSNSNPKFCSRCGSSETECLLHTQLELCHHILCSSCLFSFLQSFTSKRQSSGTTIKIQEILNFSPLCPIENCSTNLSRYDMCMTLSKDTMKEYDNWFSKLILNFVSNSKNIQLNCICTEIQNQNKQIIFHSNYISQMTADNLRSALKNRELSQKGGNQVLGKTLENYLKINGNKKNEVYFCINCNRQYCEKCLELIEKSENHFCNENKINILKVARYCHEFIILLSNNKNDNSSDNSLTRKKAKTTKTTTTTTTTTTISSKPKGVGYGGERESTQKITNELAKAHKNQIEKDKNIFVILKKMEEFFDSNEVIKFMKFDSLSSCFTKSSNSSSNSSSSSSSSSFSLLNKKNVLSSVNETILIDNDDDENENEKYKKSEKENSFSKSQQNLYLTKSCLQSGIIALLTSSSFLSNFRKLVTNDSVQDIGDRQELYDCCLSLLYRFAQDFELCRSLASPIQDEESTNNNNESELKRKNETQSSSTTTTSTTPSFGISVYNTLQQMKKQADLFLDNTEKMSLSTGKSEEEAEFLKFSQCATQITFVVNFFEEKLRQFTPQKKRHKFRKSIGPSQSDIEFKNTFSEFQLIFTTLNDHYYKSKYPKSSGVEGVKARVLRITKELSSLSTSLPIQIDSSVFVAVDESSYDYLRVLIFPSPDTPYGLAPFLFDIYLPPLYPQVPPQVQFLTTGNGKIRFNPNLYENGKVCLSLLGTWSGPSWSPTTSTLLQVIISIQSLIFVEHPYFNEPGYESMRGTSSGDNATTQYNSEQRYNTLMYAYLPSLEYPAHPFQTLLPKYFQYQQKNIIQLISKWESNSGKGNKMKEAVAQVKNALSLYPSIEPIVLE